MHDLTEQKNFMADLMVKLDFPQDAQDFFSNTLNTIEDNKVAAAWFLSILKQYDESKDCNYTQMLAHMKALSESLNIHPFTGDMILLLCMGKKMLERYNENGISEKIWLDSLLDLKYKLLDCRTRYSINGTTVGWWHPRFFALTLFALGRLQFEIFNLPKEFTVGGITLPKNTKTINMHIPRTTTPLNHDEVLESYKMAAEWFKSEFDSQPMVFRCNSWLLFPWHKEILPPGSNLIKFFDDFKIVETNISTTYGSVLSSVFNRKSDDTTENLPQDNTLRRAYAQRIERGENVGGGHGLFIYKDGKIIND